MVLGLVGEEGVCYGGYMERERKEVVNMVVGVIVVGRYGRNGDMIRVWGSVEG